MSRAEALRHCAALGIDIAALRSRGLRFIAEAKSLTPVGLGTDGRDKLLARGTAIAWLRMRQAAEADGVELLLVSGFRSIAFQSALIRMKQQRGMPLDDILRINAPPGFSEHHSGRAVDIGADSVPALDESFEASAAFAWLHEHGGEHGFVMSFPRGNRQGFLYEPWHWWFRGR